jgi:hypothetical protein
VGFFSSRRVPTLKTSRFASFLLRSRDGVDRFADFTKNPVATVIYNSKAVAEGLGHDSPGGGSLWLYDSVSNSLPGHIFI